MAILPEATLNLQNGVVYQDYPTKTFYIDPESHHVVGYTDGLQAMTQAVEIIVNIERFFWQIYSPNFGMQWRGLIGNNPDFVGVEMKKRLDNAFSVDTRIYGTSNYNYSVSGDVLTATFTVNTVYGDVSQSVEVNLI